MATEKDDKKHKQQVAPASSPAAEKTTDDDSKTSKPVAAARESLGVKTNSNNKHIENARKARLAAHTEAKGGNNV